MFEGAAKACALFGRETLGEMTLHLERLLHDAAFRVRELADHVRDLVRDDVTEHPAHRVLLEPGRIAGAFEEHPRTPNRIGAALPRTVDGMCSAAHFRSTIALDRISTETLFGSCSTDGGAVSSRHKVLTPAVPKR